MYKWSIFRPLARRKKVQTIHVNLISFKEKLDFWSFSSFDESKPFYTKETKN